MLLPILSILLSSHIDFTYIRLEGEDRYFSAIAFFPTRIEFGKEKSSTIVFTNKSSSSRWLFPSLHEGVMKASWKPNLPRKYRPYQPLADFELRLVPARGSVTINAQLSRMLRLADAKAPRYDISLVFNDQDALSYYGKPCSQGSVIKLQPFVLRRSGKGWSIGPAQ